MELQVNIFIMIGMLMVSLRGMAQDYSPKNISSSPFKWRVNVDGKKFIDQEINELLKNGVNVNNGNTKCNFKFNTEGDSKSPSAKKDGDIYSEILWLECKVGEVRIEPNVVRCEKKKNSDPEIDSLVSELIVHTSQYFASIILKNSIISYESLLNSS